MWEHLAFHVGSTLICPPGKDTTHQPAWKMFLYIVQVKCFKDYGSYWMFWVEAGVLQLISTLLPGDIFSCRSIKKQCFQQTRQLHSPKSTTSLGFFPREKLAPHLV